MKTRLVLPLGAVLAAVALLFPAGHAAAKSTLYFDFEKSLAPFTAMLSPATGFSAVRTVGDNGCPDKGQAYADLQTDTKRAGMVFWMGTTFPAEGIEMVRFQLSARDTGNCANCIPVGFAGATKPAGPGEFKPLTPDSSEPPSTGGWQTYDFENVVKTDSSILVGIGWMSPNDMTTQLAGRVRNESLLDNPDKLSITKGSYGFDCINLSVFPAP